MIYMVEVCIGLILINQLVMNQHFSTQGVLERGGFKWEDINNEGSSFCYGKGLERNMENFYDSIKLLSIIILMH